MNKLKMGHWLPQVCISAMIISIMFSIPFPKPAMGAPPATKDSMEVRLAPIFNDSMVLQHGQEVPIWGWAQAGEKVTVTIEAKSYEAVADKDGQWMVRLAAHKPGGPVEITISGSNSITLKDVLFGDVWICAGQSNMGWGVSGSASAEEMAKTNYPTIRQYFYHRSPSFQPSRGTSGNWRSANPKNVGHFCAVGFWFAKRLQQDINIPIGLIQTAYGSSSGETWIPREALLKDPCFAPMFDRAKDLTPSKLEEEQKAQKEHKAAKAKWEIDVKNARLNNQPEPAKPQEPKETYAYLMRHAPGNCFDGIIAQLIPYGIRGVIWYQGEHNASRAYQYRKLLPILIGEWRHLWNQGDFEFLIVQLANCGRAPKEACESEWAELREAQAMTARDMKNCHYAVTIETGDPKLPYDIHPRNKWDVGTRVALVALAKVYGQKLDYSGPVLESAKFEDGKAVLSFSHAQGGLLAGKDGTDKNVRGFAVAGADQKFSWADVQIDGNKLILTSEKVPQPLAVRYAWNDNPDCNLYNKAALPAAPFRTDDWPGITINKK